MISEEISEEECTDNWMTSGWCNCKRCHSFSDAYDSVSDVTKPTSKFQLFRMILEKTGQTPDEANENLDDMIDLGVLSEECKNMFVFV